MDRAGCVDALMGVKMLDAFVGAALARSDLVIVEVDQLGFYSTGLQTLQHEFGKVITVAARPGADYQCDGFHGDFMVSSSPAFR